MIFLMHMIELQLKKVMKLPATKEELNAESLLDKHERWLRTLLIKGFTPIYIGDSVNVTKKWCGDRKNPHAGKHGEIINMTYEVQAALNLDYLIYTIRTGDGGSFETYYYTLNRLYQPKENQLLEKILRETNTNFK